MVEVEKCMLGIFVSLFVFFMNYFYWVWFVFKKIKMCNSEGEEVFVYVVDCVECDKVMICFVSEVKWCGLFDLEKVVCGWGGWLVDNGSFIWNLGEYFWIVD